MTADKPTLAVEGKLYSPAGKRKFYARLIQEEMDMARAGKELIKRLTAPKIRDIVREEISAGLRPLEVKIEEMDKRLAGEISSLRRELQYAPKVAVLEAKVTELERRMAVH